MPVATPALRAIPRNANPRARPRPMSINLRSGGSQPASAAACRLDCSSNLQMHGACPGWLPHKPRGAQAFAGAGT
jgi:hypothetical protein